MPPHRHKESSPNIALVSKNINSTTLKLLQFILNEKTPVNLPILLRAYCSALTCNKDEISKNPKLKRRLDMRLRRLIAKLEAQDLLITYKEDGLIWILPTPTLVDLIKRIAKFKLGYSKPVHEARARARSVLLKKKSLSLLDWEYLFNLLIFYEDDVSHKRLVFMHKTEDKLKILPYTHRFLEHKVKEKLRDFDRLWEIASSKYKFAVFLTLTLDPKTYSNLKEACKLISESWNRLMSYFTKKFGFRPTYIKILEPQDSGNPHLHVVFFGIKRLGDHKKLTPIFKRLGFGIIHWEYQIINNNGRWIFKRARPRGSRTHVQAYLKKYLRKMLSHALNPPDLDPISGEPIREPDLDDRKIAFFFASNMRFFTYSRVFDEAKKVQIMSFWIFIGVFYDYQLLEPAFIEKLIETRGIP